MTLDFSLGRRQTISDSGASWFVLVCAVLCSKNKPILEHWISKKEAEQRIT